MENKENNNNEPSIFEKLAAAAEGISLIAGGGVNVPLNETTIENEQPESSIIQEIESNYNSYDLERQTNNEDFSEVEITSALEEQLESWTEISKENEISQREEELEISSIVGNQSIASGSPPDSEFEYVESQEWEGEGESEGYESESE